MPQIVGPMLQKARAEKQLTLEKVSLDLKIRKKYLEALETEQFGIFSSPIHVTGFLKNYSMYLGLDPNQVLAFYRRDFGAVKDAAQNIKPVLVALPWFSPNKMAAVGAVLIFLAFFTYLLWQYSQFLKPPQMRVDNPSADVRVKSLEITVSGRVGPETTLQINGQEITVAAEGSFKETIALKSGINVINFMATNKSGRQTKFTRNVVSE